MHFRRLTHHRDIVSKYDLNHLRFVMVGAAPLGQDVAAAFVKRFPQVVFGQGSGMTETATCTTLFPGPSTGAPKVPGSAGTLIPNVWLKVLDPISGEKLSIGQRGELCFRSPSNALGYLGDDKATKVYFWLQTGHGLG